VLACCPAFLCMVHACAWVAFAGGASSRSSTSYRAYLQYRTSLGGRACLNSYRHVMTAAGAEQKRATAASR
jgi:hypothetical protein